MASSTLHALTENTSPAIGDELYLLGTPTGTPANNRITLGNLLKFVNGLTEDTEPDGTADFIPSYDTSATSVKKVLKKNVGSYVLRAGFSASDPADATTYYFGSFDSLTLATPAAGRRIYFPRAGIITAVDIYIVVGTTLGSSETSSLYLRVNNTTDTLLTSSIALNATPYHETVTGLSTTAASLSYFELKWVTPTWATNPTNLFGLCSILVS